MNMMLKLKKGCNFNGVHSQALNFIHGFNRLLFYSTSSRSPYSDICYYEYLTRHLGFSSEQYVSFDAKLPACSLHPYYVNLKVEFLKKNGFDITQIRKLFLLYPRLIKYRTSTLNIQIELLQDIGVRGRDLSTLIEANPKFQLPQSTLDILIVILRRVLGNNENVVRVIKLCPFGNPIRRIGFRNLAPNVQLLRKYDIPNDLILKHIFKDPYPFFLETQEFEETLIRVEKELEIPRDAAMFLYGVRFLARYCKKKIISKFRVYKRCGWTESEIMALMRNNPECLGFSDNMISCKLLSLMVHRSYQPSYLASESGSGLFTCSLKERIVLRYNLIVALKAKGLMRMDYHLYTVLLMNESLLNESQPVNKVVLPYEEVYRTYAKLIGCSVMPANSRKHTGG